jgi:hypothetical protein
MPLRNLMPLFCYIHVRLCAPHFVVSKLANQWHSENDHQISLCFSTAVLYRPQQVRVDSLPAGPGFGHRTDHLSGGSPRSSAHSARGPRSLRAPTHSATGSPTANASPFPGRSGCAASHHAANCMILLCEKKRRSIRMCPGLTQRPICPTFWASWGGNQRSWASQNKVSTLPG